MISREGCVKNREKQTGKGQQSQYTGISKCPADREKEEVETIELINAQVMQRCIQAY